MPTDKQRRLRVRRKYKRPARTERDYKNRLSAEERKEELLKKNRGRNFLERLSYFLTGDEIPDPRETKLYELRDNDRWIMPKGMDPKTGDINLPMGELDLPDLTRFTRDRKKKKKEEKNTDLLQSFSGLQNFLDR